MDAHNGALLTARTKYLEQQTLLRELEDLVNDVQYVITEDSYSSDQHPEANSCNTDAKLRHAGLNCPAAAVTSLSEHLQASYIAQRLQLPSAALNAAHTGGAAGSSRSDAEAGSDQLSGSKHHILGITPLQLRKQHMPSRRAAQKAHAPILPVLERRLEQRAHAAVEAITGESAGPDAAAHTVSLIQSKQIHVSELEDGCMKQLKAYTGTAQAYLQELMDVQHILQQLLADSILVVQPRLDQEHREYLKDSVHHFKSKLQAMQIQLRANTYTKETVPALRSIHSELDRLEQQTLETIEQVTAQLQAYAQLPPEFRDIVESYGQIKSEEHTLEGFLEGLERVEAEAAFC